MHAHVMYIDPSTLAQSAVHTPMPEGTPVSETTPTPVSKTTPTPVSETTPTPVHGAPSTDDPDATPPPNKKRRLARPLSSVSPMIHPISQLLQSFPSAEFNFAGEEYSL